jgi:hypothetical protein
LDERHSSEPTYYKDDRRNAALYGHRRASPSVAERPYIFVFGVTEFKYIDNYEYGESAFVEYNVANYGRTPEIIEDTNVDFLIPRVGTIDNVGPVLEDHPLYISRIIAPGEKRDPIEHHRWRVTNVDNHDSFADLKLTKREAEEGEKLYVTPVLEDGVNLYFRVVIKYRGPVTTGHETSACWRYLKGTGRFELAGGGTNYEK